ncbi:MAG: hypothetical protein IKX93_02440 [Bacteroidaceae bacterium]|nr:hypothetical protein [Bacteroidaceae bacterium]
MEDIKIFKSQKQNIVFLLCSIVLFLVCLAAYRNGRVVGWLNDLYTVGLILSGIGALAFLFFFLKNKIKSKPYIVLSSAEAVLEGGKKTLPYAYVESFSTNGNEIVVKYKSAEELNRILENGGCVTREKIKELADGQISFSVKGLTESPEVLYNLLCGRLAIFQLSQK